MFRVHDVEATKKSDIFEFMKLAASVLTFISVFVLASCLKPEVYPDEPQLTFSTLTLYPDSAELRFDFVDGNGDFGIDSDEVNDTNSVFSDCPNQFNMLLEYFEKQNGSWVKIPRNPCAGEVGFYYTVPWIKPTGQNQTQKGSIKIVVAPSYYIPSNFDTCRFEAQIVDRAFNRSNVVQSSVFYKR
jgi:hypothetical protein